MATLEINGFFNSNNLSDQVENNEYENANVGADILRLDTLTLSQDHQSACTDNWDDGEMQETLYDAADKTQLDNERILSSQLVEEGMENLGRTADGSRLAYLHLRLTNMKIGDISLLGNYTNLQKIEMPHNNITDLSVLSNLPDLVELDVSHNCIEQVLLFQAPRCLKIVNLSFNNISELRDLSDFQYLQTLILDNNNISEIAGVDKCRRLRHLSLAHNNIGCIRGLVCLPISTLRLAGNKLTAIDNLDSLRYMKVLDLSGNKIRSLRGLENNEFLESADLEDNEVIDLHEVLHLSTLGQLRELNLQRNPIVELPDYRQSVLFTLPRLTSLDRHRVTCEEKVAAQNMFNPPMEMLAARDHMMHVVYSFIQQNRLLDCTLPSTEVPYPILVLVGPQGSGKKDLALKLVEEFPDYFVYGVSHTTRPQRHGEENGREYHFVSLDDFEVLLKSGRFLQTNVCRGHLYGFSIDSLEAVAAEGLACIVHMELEGVLTLKNSHFEPRFVLIVPHERDTHERRLRDKSYTDEEMEQVRQRVDLYGQYDREHPGFFDMTISSDDISQAYTRLRMLIMDYLGLSSTPEGFELEQSRTELELLSKELSDLGTLQSRSKHSLTTGKMSPLFRAKPSSSTTVQCGSVEEESLNRRQSALRTMIDKGSLRQGPLKAMSHPFSAQAMVYRSVSAPVPGEKVTRGWLESSDKSRLSLYDEDDEEQQVRGQGHIERLELKSWSAVSPTSGPEAPRPDTDDAMLPEHPASASKHTSPVDKSLKAPGNSPGQVSAQRTMSRPGSNVYSVLPAIAAGPQYY